MNHEHMNVKNVKDEVEPTGPKKPWVTPRLDDLDCEVNTEGNSIPNAGFDGITYETYS